MPFLWPRNYFLHNYLRANPNIFAQDIPTFSRKETPYPNIFAQDIPTFSRKSANPNIFAQNRHKRIQKAAFHALPGYFSCQISPSDFQGIPTFSRKDFAKSQHFRARYHINCLIISGL